MSRAEFERRRKACIGDARLDYLRLSKADQRRITAELDAIVARCAERAKEPNPIIAATDKLALSIDGKMRPVWRSLI
jgi:hypothetical protein